MFSSSTTSPSSDRHGPIVIVIANLLLSGMVALGALMVLGSLSALAQGQSLVFAGLMGACGLFVGGFGLERFYVLYIRAALERRRENETRNSHPGQPWMLKEDWARATVADYKSGQVIFLWIFLIGWTGGIVMLLNEKQTEIRQAASEYPLQAPMLCLFFGLITLMAMVLTIRSTFAWKRTGDGFLTLQTLPGVVGSRFEACFRTRSRRRLSVPVKAELRCMRDDGAATQTGARRVAMPSLIFSCEISIRPEDWKIDEDGNYVMLGFDIPRDLPSTDPHAGIEWTLSLASCKTSDDFVLFQFAVPVYDTGRDGRIRE